MGSPSRSRNPFPSSSTRGPHHPSFTRTHQIGALVLVAVTFVLTRAFDRLSCSLSSITSSVSLLDRSSNGGFNWPERGFGSRLDLKIYVYDDAEIDGLRELMRGRDGKISANACLKGQWGTQKGEIILQKILNWFGSRLDLKIYVYDDAEIDGLRELMRGRDGKISANACLKGQWGTQVKIHQFLLKSKFRTTKKGEADLFFVPSYVKCVRMMGGLNDKEINHTYVKVLSQMPHFRLSGGRNHVFVFPSGAGAHLFRSWATFLNRSIILTPEGDRTDKRDITSFNTWKDIIIPGNVDDGMTTFYGSPIVQPIPLSKRKYLANFLGRAQGKTGRLQLVELAKRYPDKLEAPELKLTGPNKLGRTEYFNHLKSAKFCLSPRGESSWTLRFYESYFVGCVPVILSDQVELPFQDVIDYSEISIKWPSTRTGPQLLEYLESIPDDEIEEMIARGRKIRCLWVYAEETEPCSAMLGILWELQRKVRRFHQSAETFWLHNRSIVNRDLIEFHNWRTLVPLP